MKFPKFFDFHAVFTRFSRISVYFRVFRHEPASVLKMNSVISFKSITSQVELFLKPTFRSNFGFSFKIEGESDRDFMGTPRGEVNPV